jgi:hypothetical protein
MKKQPPMRRLYDPNWPVSTTLWLAAVIYLVVTSMVRDTSHESWLASLGLGALGFGIYVAAVQADRVLWRKRQRLAADRSEKAAS